MTQLSNINIKEITNMKKKNNDSWATQGNVSGKALSTSIIYIYIYNFFPLVHHFDRHGECIV